MGFRNLYGIELQSYALELSKSMTRRINIIEGLAFDISYRDRYFDLVLASWVLIHIAPSNIALAMRGVHKCRSEYTLGFEYYADKHTEITYRGYENLLWKGGL